jgi:hypothetical protein
VIVASAKSVTQRCDCDLLTTNNYKILVSNPSFLRNFGEHSEISEDFEWVGRVFHLAYKSYVAVSMGVSLRRNSFRELARFLRSG